MNDKNQSEISLSIAQGEIATLKNVMLQNQIKSDKMTEKFSKDLQLQNEKYIFEKEELIKANNGNKADNIMSRRFQCCYLNYLCRYEM